MTSSFSSHGCWARAATLSSVSVGASSSARFFFAWSMLISEVAIRMFTVAGVEPRVARRRPAAAGSMPLAVIGLSKVA